MFVKIVSHGKFELEKIGVSVDDMSVKRFLQLRLSKWSQFQLRSRVESLESILLKAGEPSLLLKELLSPLFSSKFHLALLEKGGVQVDEKFLGKEQRAVIVAGRLARDIPNKRRDSHEYSKVSVDHMIKTIKLTGLNSEVHGDNLILARSVQCCWRYAKKVLKAVTTGSEESLYTRIPWTGAIKGTEWPLLLRKFLYEPENSRTNPGQDLVSVGRNLPKVPKRILIRSKEKIIAEFLVKYPECTFKKSVLIREIPQECRSPTTRDFARNSCVACTNIRAIMTRLRMAGLLQDILSSTRAIAALRVCNSYPEFDPLNVLSWKENCSHGLCESCPGWELQLPLGKEEEVVTVYLWGDNMCPIKKKKVS